MILTSNNADGLSKIWLLPEQGTADGIDCATTLPGRGRNCAAKWNPACAGILCIGNHQGELQLWDMRQCQRVLKVDLEQPLASLMWSWRGDLLGATTNPTTMEVFDPRTPEPVIRRKIHGISKPTKFAWLSSATRANEYVLTAGWSSTKQRELAVWDLRGLGEPVATTAIDISMRSPDILIDGGTGAIICCTKVSFIQLKHILGGTFLQGLSIQWDKFRENHVL